MHLSFDANLTMEQMFNHIRSKIHPKLETFKTPLFHSFHPHCTTISALEKTHILTSFNQFGLSFKVLVELEARLLLCSPRSGYKFHNSRVSVPLPLYPPGKNLGKVSALELCKPTSPPRCWEPALLNLP